jgi:DNA-binding response OmpR family regulator
MGGLCTKDLVLIADDEPALLEVFQLVLTPTYEVITAPDGETAWAHIQQCQPAVILLDMHLPRRSGVALAAAIRAEPELAAATVLLMTGLSEAAAQDAVRATGADGVLLKPIRIQELVAAIEKAVRHSGPQGSCTRQRGGQAG